MIAVNIVGFKKSGKTALAVELISELTRLGARVAAAKSTHNQHLDKQDTDTAKLAKEAVAVAAATPAEAAVFWSAPRHLADLLPLLGAEVVVVEGGKELAYLPRIILAKDAAEAGTLDPDGLALANFGPADVPGLPKPATVAELAKLVLDRAFLLPGLDCGGCGHETCSGLAAAIVKGLAKPADCVSANGTMRVSVAGQTLALNPFVERMLSSGIKAMLAELKGYVPGPIEISIE